MAIRLQVYDLLLPCQASGLGRAPLYIQILKETGASAKEQRPMDWALSDEEHKATAIWLKLRM